MMALHPKIKAWIEDINNQTLLSKIIDALGKVGRFGEIKIQVHQGKVAEIESIARKKH